jgi:uncharacterized membrane protein YhaH (DUF805 family)
MASGFQRIPANPDIRRAVFAEVLSWQPVGPEVRRSQSIRIAPMWYYSNNDDQQGPVDEAAIPQLIANETLNPSSLVWKEGMADWLPLGESELAGFLAPAPATRRPVLVVPSGSSIHSVPHAENPFHPPRSSALHRQPMLATKMTWSQILWSFDGRIPRRTYWGCIGIWMGVFFGAGMLGVLLSQVARNEMISGIVMFFLLVPYLWSIIAVQVKRWHDRGKSGAMVLINFIPVIGGIWAFVECGCLRGTVGRNPYGQDPT